jgi:hypothetical protein
VQHLENFLIPTLSYYKSSVRASPSLSLPIKNSPEDIANNNNNTSKDLF